MLEVVSLERAMKITDEKFSGVFAGVQTVKLENAYARITAEDIFSWEDVPSFSRSTMDGYALKAKDTFGASESIPSVLEIDGDILMGENTASAVSDGHCFRIPTGGMLPEGADAVIPVEYTDEEQKFECLIYKSVSPLENVTGKGDDVKNGQLVIKKGKKLSYTDIGVLATMGIDEIKVVTKPVVGIISTGDELVEIGEKPLYGQVRDVNSRILHAFCLSHGCETKVYGIIRDVRDELKSVIERAAAECDCVLISGGSSAGERDMTAGVISELGEVFVHGIAMKPGKPTIIGKINGKAVFGLPGHPAACCFVAMGVVLNYIDGFTGHVSEKRYRKCILSENISSNHGREEFVCVRVEDGIAYPLHGKSGVISLLSSCDGYICIDRESEGLVKGQNVRVYYF